MGMFTLLPSAEKIITKRDARNALAVLEKANLMAFDTETTGISRTCDRAILLGLSSGPNRYAIWPGVMPYFTDLLQDPSKTLIAHGANFDAWMMLNVGVDITAYEDRKKARVYDTMVMSSLVSDFTPNDLKFQTRAHLGVEMQKFAQTFGLKGRSMSKPLEQILLDPSYEGITARYASLDAWTTYHLFFKLAAKLESMDAVAPYGNMMGYYTDIEVPFTKILWGMERHGMKIDTGWLLEKAPVFEAEMLEVEKWFAKKLKRFDFNIASTPQLSELFHKKLKYKPRSYTEGGSPQVNDVVLKYWVKHRGCEFAEQLLKWRNAHKKLSTYIVNILDNTHTDGRVHPTFSQAGTDTGRLASKDPNAQNQPPWIREAFIAEEGKVLLASDYAQLEMRIMAHLSKDGTLCKAIRNGLDIHSSTAAMMYDVPYDKIFAAKNRDDEDQPALSGDKELLGMRKAAKAIGFGLLYGQGKRALSEALHCDVDEAGEAMGRFNRKLAAIPRYFKGAISRAGENTYCQTMLGRRRQLLGYNSPMHGDVAACERRTKNSPIQGSAAEIAKLAMIRIHRNDYIYATGARMVAQVHDEVVFELDAAVAKDPMFLGELQDCMMHPLEKDLVVPLDTTTKSGKTWLEAK